MPGGRCRERIVYVPGGKSRSERSGRAGPHRAGPRRTAPGRWVGTVAKTGTRSRPAPRRAGQCGLSAGRARRPGLLRPRSGARPAAGSVPPAPRGLGRSVRAEALSRQLPGLPAGLSPWAAERRSRGEPAVGSCSRGGGCWVSRSCQSHGEAATAPGPRGWGDSALRVPSRTGAPATAGCWGSRAGGFGC